jgi:hypothetical protein
MLDYNHKMVRTVEAVKTTFVCYPLSFNSFILRISFWKPVGVHYNSFIENPIHFTSSRPISLCHILTSDYHPCMTLQVVSLKRPVNILQANTATQTTHHNHLDLIVLTVVCKKHNCEAHTKAIF